MAFNVNIFAKKWNYTLRDTSLLARIASTEFTTGQVRGDRVKVSALSGITVQDYVKGTAISYDSISSDDKDIIMDKSKIFAGIVEDIDEVQTNPNLLNGVIEEGVSNLTEQMDKDVFEQIVNDADANGDKIDLSGVTLTKDNVLEELLIPALTFLNTTKAAKDDRYMIVDPSTYSLIVGLDIAESDTGLGKGFGKNVMGMYIDYSNELPANRGIVGSKKSTGFGYSLSKVKTMDSETQVGTAIQALNVYGAKVIKNGVAEIIFA